MTTVTKSWILLIALAGCGGAMPGSVTRDNSSGTQPSSNTSHACAQALASGDAHVCALRTDGAVLCWGLDTRGQLGVGDAVNRSVPTLVALPEPAVEVAAGSSHACARLQSGGVACWGENAQGQLGDGTTTPRPSPITVAGLDDATALAAGAEHTCALRAGGAVVCWGDDEQGQLGDGRDGLGTKSSTPVAAATPGSIVELSARGDHTCARAGDGSVWCWGSNVSGELGDGTTGAGHHASTPLVVAGLHALAIAVGSAHTCAITPSETDESLTCWGNNSSGQLGLGYISWNAPGAVPTPQPLGSLHQVGRLAAGQAHTCARDRSGTLSCWGVDGRGQLGNGAVTQPAERGVPTPTVVPGLQVDALSAGATHTCAIARDGTPFCWGGNRNGELGTGGGPDDVLTPTPVALPCP